jgi:hypothetical protein
MILRRDDMDTLSARFSREQHEANGAGRNKAAEAIKSG